MEGGGDVWSELETFECSKSGSRKMMSVCRQRAVRVLWLYEELPVFGVLWDCQCVCERETIVDVSSGRCGGSMELMVVVMVVVDVVVVVVVVVSAAAVAIVVFV